MKREDREHVIKLVAMLRNEVNIYEITLQDLAKFLAIGTATLKTMQAELDRLEKLLIEA